MLRRLIDWSTENRFLIFLFVAATIGMGVWAVRRTRLEALEVCDESGCQAVFAANETHSASFCF